MIVNSFVPVMSLGKSQLNPRFQLVDFIFYDVMVVIQKRRRAVILIFLKGADRDEPPWIIVYCVGLIQFDLICCQKQKLVSHSWLIMLRSI